MKTKFLIIGILAFSNFLFADFVTEVSSLYNSASDTKVIGKILPTAEVEVLQKEGDRAKIKISGYQEDNKPALYFVAGKRILNAGFDSKAKVEFQKLQTKQVDGKEYTLAQTEAWIEAKYLTKDVKPLLSKGKDLFEKNCAMCHALHQTKEFTANQWPSMFKSMAGRTGIDKKDYQLVIQYLQKNAKDMK